MQGGGGVNAINSLIKRRRRERSGRNEKGNGMEDALVVSKTHLRQDYKRENRSGLQRAERREKEEEA